MKELFRQTGHSIFTFKKGDIIIQVEATVITERMYNENLGVETEVIREHKDGTFRKEPVEFIAVQNNVIYLRTLKPMFDGKPYVYKVPVEQFCDGWALFTIPEGLTLNDCI